MKKLVVITGATSGIGEAAARQLAAQGMNLAIVGRSSARGKQLLDSLREAYPGNNYDYFTADLSVLQQVRDVAGVIAKRYPVIDVLINNAGGVFAKYETTAEGVEKTLANNHLNYFVLTGLLLGNIKRAGDGRIIIVSSASHYRARLDFESFTNGKGYFIMKAYAQSKLANLMFAYALARRLADTPVTVTALHPGVIRTGIGAKTGSALLKWIWNAFAMLRNTGTPDDSAKTYVYLATSPDAPQHHGQYFHDGKPTTSSELSYDEALQERLWKWSEEVTGVVY